MALMTCIRKIHEFGSLPLSWSFFVAPRSDGGLPNHIYRIRFNIRSDRTGDDVYIRKTLHSRNDLLRARGTRSITPGAAD